METILGLCIGIGLSAACGFRVFVPLLVMSLASILGWFEPMQGFEWLSMPSVCIALAIATVCEIAAYYIPWVDNAFRHHRNASRNGRRNTHHYGGQQWGNVAVCQLGCGNYYRWGAAGAVQMSTVAVRGVSTATTGRGSQPTGVYSGVGRCRFTVRTFTYWFQSWW